MAENDPPQPKIIVDSDWKSQARAEKQRLEEAERTGPQRPRPGTGPATAAAAPGAPAEHPDEAPPADFSALLGTLVTQALLYLGGFPDPQTGRAVVSLEHARLYIDLLQVLQDKTKGNLSADESEDLAQALNELRLRFVEVSRAVSAMVAKRAAEGQGAVPPGPAAFGSLRTPQQ
ncbi:MAG TPA: DUF1844 domain-containing protein [Phycisphaerales bacterium]|nr:DUF1844 domain-containing protein [Phycisphaerales bacterium]